MEETVRRTPEILLEDLFLKAAASLPEGHDRAEVVARALGHLQRGFEAHYGCGPEGATNDGVLVGDNAYALSVQTIARLDEPRFVAIAGRMIRDGAGRIAAGEPVSVETWTPHLADLLDVVSGEGRQKSLERVREAARELRDEFQ